MPSHSHVPSNPKGTQQQSDEDLLSNLASNDVTKPQADIPATLGPTSTPSAIQRRLSSMPANDRASAVYGLQRQVGNAAVQRMLKGGSPTRAIQRMPAIAVQRSLVDEMNDSGEAGREAAQSNPNKDLIGSVTNVGDITAAKALADKIGGYEPGILEGIKTGTIQGEALTQNAKTRGALNHYVMMAGEQSRTLGDFQTSVQQVQVDYESLMAKMQPLFDSGLVDKNADIKTQAQQINVAGAINDNNANSVIKGSEQKNVINLLKSNVTKARGDLNKASGSIGKAANRSHTAVLNLSSKVNKLEARTWEGVKSEDKDLQARKAAIQGQISNVKQKVGLILSGAQSVIAMLPAGAAGKAIGAIGAAGSALVTPQANYNETVVGPSEDEKTVRSMKSGIGDDVAKGTAGVMEFMDQHSGTAKEYAGKALGVYGDVTGEDTSIENMIASEITKAQGLDGDLRKVDAQIDADTQLKQDSVMKSAALEAIAAYSEMITAFKEQEEAAKSYSDAQKLYNDNLKSYTEALDDAAAKQSKTGAGGQQFAVIGAVLADADQVKQRVAQALRLGQVEIDAAKGGGLKGPEGAGANAADARKDASKMSFYEPRKDKQWRDHEVQEVYIAVENIAGLADLVRGDQSAAYADNPGGSNPNSAVNPTVDIYMEQLKQYEKMLNTLTTQLASKLGI